MRAMLMGLVSAGLFAVPLTSQAGFMGQEFTASYRYPDVSTTYPMSSFSPPTFNVAAGQDTIGDIEGVTELLVDFGDTWLNITLNTQLSNPTWNGTSFNGPVFTATLANGITSATVDGVATTMSGFDNSRISFDSDEIFVNWQGLSYMDGTVMRVDFEFAAVPEPGTLALLALGLGGLGGLGLRRHEKA